ncbi:hypothetical protein [Bacillus atrophaeus]|nr:hypothetical protein [Bacillus atrophaeus]
MGQNFFRMVSVSGYEHEEAAELEVYPASEDIHVADHRAEIWIPVVKK